MEQELVSWLRRHLPQTNRVLVGPGDDAAILASSSDDIVVTTDMLMDGVDFLLAEHEEERIGRKSLAVNLSDLAAMAARPLAAFVSLAIPRTLPLRSVERLYEGMFPLASQYNLAIAGGDTNSWDGPLALSVTAIGEVSRDRRWLRSGARVGDVILVTGSLGGSILGKHFDFTPRVHEALALAERYDIHAAMDISDGLSLDLSRLCAESDCGACLDLGAIPISDVAERLSRERPGGKSPLDHALSDGEDFELLMTTTRDEANRILAERPVSIRVSIIGEIVAETGLWAKHEVGRITIQPSGYLH